VYIYATVISEKFFGVTPFAVRFPSAFFGILTLLTFFFFVRKTTGDHTIASWSTIFLAFNPWHLHYSRATFEVSIVLFCFVCGTWMFLVAMGKGRSFLLPLSIILFAIAMYSYNLTRILSPVLGFSLAIFNVGSIKKMSHSWLFVSAVIAILALLPFIATLKDSGGQQSAAGTLISSSAVTQAKILEFRSYLAPYPLVSKVFNTPALTLATYFSNVASYASIPFFFLTGSPHGNHGITTHGQFYLFELPLMVLGLYYLYKNKIKLGISIILPALLTIGIASLTREAPHATRSYPMLLSLPIISAYGFTVVALWIKKQRFSLKMTCIYDTRKMLKSKL
jgi:4-amino-4-deoxy-L-arabinose transferase-like glycosyltransferase